MVDLAQVARHLAGYDHQSNRADRQVEVEDPAPRELIDEEPASSGPTMLARPKTAPKRHTYRPRSRGETMSPMMACAPTIKPPAPNPVRTERR